MFKPAKDKIEGLTWQAFTGTVMDNQVWSETRVSGGGGGVMINGIGVGSSRTNSTVTNKREFSVQAPDGLQDIFSFNADAVKVAAGQVVTMVRVSRNGGKSWTNLAFINHSMRKTTMLQGVLALFPLYGFLAFGAVPASALGLFLMGGDTLIGLLLLLGNLIHMRPVALKREIDAKRDEMIKQAEVLAAGLIQASVPPVAQVAAA